LFDIKDIKNNIIKIGERLYNGGFTSGISGNISFRQNGQIFITATGTCLGELSEEKIIILDEEGNQILNQVQNDSCNNIKPSSECMMHVEIYKARPEINAIIHAHPPYCTALAVSGEAKFPAILAEPVVLFGENIPVVKYETPSTLELAKSVAKFFEENDAVFMANHGATVCGHDLKETFYKLETLEFYSRVYLFSGLMGKRSELSAENIQALLKFRH